MSDMTQVTAKFGIIPANDKDAAKEAEEEKAANEGWQAWEDWDKWEEPKSKEKISSDSDDLQKKEE